MKIGLLTYFTGDSHGQILQVYATINSLYRRFPNSVIEILPFYDGKKSRPSLRPSFFVQSCYQLFLNTIEKRQLIGSAIMHRVKSITDVDVLVDYVNSKGFDIVLTGSDVCLNFSDHKGSDELSFYWLSERIKAKTGFLAASADIAEIHDLTESQLSHARNILLSLSFVSVRDLMTETLINEIAGDAIEIVRLPDPVFTLNNLTARPRFKQRSGRLVCAVNLGPCDFSVDIIKMLNEQFDLLSMNINNSKYLKPTFFTHNQWVGAFDRIDFLVTSSFHESILAVKNRIPFVMVDTSMTRVSSDGKGSKTCSLASDLGVEDRHFSRFNGSQPSEVINKVREVLAYSDLDRLQALGNVFGRRYEQYLEEVL
jgi:hypothetical protein